MESFIFLAERGLLPDVAIRWGIRRLLAMRQSQLGDLQGKNDRILEQLRQGPLAVATDAANEQHYEAPTEFFQKVLGPRLKYSCCLFDEATPTLSDAESEMLGLTVARAEVQDGMKVLELGCGWGSLTLWLAEKFPACRVTAVTNSSTQRAYIAGQARERGLSSVNVVEADMCDFSTVAKFDRVLSIEMFEHMRNYELLFERVASWLAPGGKAFVHVFCNRRAPYLFEQTGENDWMARHFFTGGVMPSAGLFWSFDEHLVVAREWRVDGLQYWRTCEAWLANLDRNRSDLLRVFAASLSPTDARIALQRWRMFFMACAELFKFNGGQEWLVNHYLLEPKEETESTRCPVGDDVSHSNTPEHVRGTRARS